MGIPRQTSIESPSFLLDPSAYQIPPTSQEILQVEQELIDCLRRKKQVDRQLLDLEVQLYHYETSYFEKYPNGNLLKGFDPASFSLATSGGSLAPIPEEDRLFSNSSMTYQKALALKEKLAQKMHRLEQHHESEDVFMHDDDGDTSVGGSTPHRRNLLSKKLKAKSNKLALSSMKKSSGTSDMSKKLLRIRTRIADE